MRPRGRQRGQLGKPHVTTERVIQMYKAGKTTYEIADAVGMSQGGVYRRLVNSGLKLRGQFDKWGKQPSTKTLIAFYARGLSADAIATRVNRSQCWILRALKKAGVKARGPADYPKLTGADNPAWRGGRFTADSGYVFVRVPGDRKARPEHRVVMERILGRPLSKSEIVHHMNGVRDDNRPENLVVTTLKEHEHYTYVKALQARIRELEAAHSETLRGAGSGRIDNA